MSAEKIDAMSDAERDEIAQQSMSLLREFAKLAHRRPSGVVLSACASLAVLCISQSPENKDELFADQVALMRALLGEYRKQALAHAFRSMTTPVPWDDDYAGG
jgi:hypothetical protein